jgi:ankyrin repeat protein
LARNRQGQTPLHKLIEHKHGDILKNIFDRFPAQKTTFMAAKDENGRTLVHLAALSGDLDTLKFILSLGADVNQRDHNGDTPLHLAIQSRHPLPIIQLLLDLNANTTLKNSII